jgi:uncharacterized protein (DUF608 family)
VSQSASAGDSAPVTKSFGEKLIGSLTRKMKLAPGASAKVTFVLTWHMPNLKLSRLPGGRHYASRFASAYVVARYVREHFPRLSSQTRLWHDTWYDSTLPYWFLDRTFLNTSILATSTCHRFSNGRFYGWEGVGCCEGTCGHVWHYAHAVARLFPELERMTREKVGLGLCASQRQRPGLGGRLFQRVHERLRVPGRRPHALGRNADRKPGRHTGHP